MIEYTVRVYHDGSKEWYLNDKPHQKLHREDGPAVELANGYKSWWLNNQQVTQEEHKRKTSKVIEMTVAEISKALGKQVKVVE
jgi:hypothetical protein